jgi:mannose-6-phosphate isomerase-like protein (cupin superfamily)
VADYKVVKIDDMEAIAFGTFRRARAELDVSAFGVQILDLPPNLDAYPEHDHAEDGQEEVYFVLRGGGEIEIDGERFPLDPETAVSVKSGTRRKLWPKPGAVYERKEISELGAPDPYASVVS